MNQHNNAKTLGSFCQNGSVSKTRIALLSFYNVRYSDWTEKLIVLFEYLQLISQILILHANAYTGSQSENQLFFDAVVYFFKLINPSYLFPFEHDNLLSKIILFIVFGSMVFKYVLFLYIIGVARWNLKGFSLLIEIWRWVFKVQGRMLCFFTTSFWIRAILSTSDNEFTVFGMSSVLLIIISGLLIIIEYLFSIFMEIQFCSVLPNKNFLSSKSYRLQIITLVQKLCLQIFEVSFVPDALASFWVLNTLNLAFCFLRNYFFYALLPVYKFKALFYQGELLSLVLSMNCACILQTLLKTIDYLEAEIKFIIAVWIIKSILIAKISRELLNKILLNLLTKQYDGSSELLIHKVFATKELRKVEKMPSENTRKYDLTYLMRTTENAHIKNIFGISLEGSPNMAKNLNNKNVINKIFIQYLEGLSVKLPNSSLIKLHLAYMCSKHTELFQKAIKLSSELKKSGWPIDNLNASLLLYEIEKAILKQENEEMNLDLLTYMKSQILMDELKKEIMEQIDLKIKICNNITEDVSNIGEIFKCSQIIDKSKAIIQKKMSSLSHIVPDYYLEPIQVCAEYSSILNYSLETFQKFEDLYNKKYLKYDKHFKDLNLNQENLYQGSNVFLILSAQKVDNGRIVFCTKGIENLCGDEKSSYYGTHISSMFSPSLQPYYNDLLKQVFEKGKKSVLNKITQAYLFHKDNYLVEAEFYLRIHPYITQNLYFNMVIRPMPSTREYMIVKENGDIEAASKKIGHILGLTPSSNSSLSINVKFISGELQKINRAFNVIYKSGLMESINNNLQKKDDTEKKRLSFCPSVADKADFDNSMELYELFSSKGQVIELSRAMQLFTNPKDRSSYSYWCQVSILPYESVFMKLVSLEEAYVEDDQDEQDEVLENTKLGRRSVRLYGTGEGILFQKDGDKDCNSVTGSENIDYSEVDNGVDLVYLWKKETNEATEDNLYHKTSLQTQLVSPSSSNTRLRGNHFAKQKTTLNSPGSGVTFKKVKKEKKKKVKRSEGAYLGQSNQSSYVRGVYNGFNRALTTKSYPRSFNILCIMFYLIILLTFGCQIILKVVTDNTMQDLELKKNMLKFAQFRSYRAVIININCIGSVLQVGGAASAAQLAAVALQTVDVVKNMENYRKDLENLNKEILKGICSLDEDIKTKLFAKDVRIYGSYVDSLEKSSKNVTTFEVINEISNAIKRLYTLPTAASIEGYHAFNFMALNILDDFSYKNNEITEIFVDSVQSQKEYLQKIIVLCLIITPLLLAGIAVTLILIIWNQYIHARNLMLALIKLPPVGVRNILVNLKTMKKNLSDEDYYKFKQPIEFNDDLSSSNKQASYQKKHHAQIVKYAEFKVKYFAYTIRVVFYIFALIGIISWNYVSAQNSTKIIYRRQNQLEFANYISARVTMSYVSFTQLFLSNNTNRVEHLSPWLGLTRGIEEIKNIRTQAQNKFLELDGSYDPEIEAALFADNTACQKLTGNSITYCKFLTGQGQPINLLSLLATYELQLSYKVTDYQAIYLTSAGALLGSALKANNFLLPTFGLTASVAQNIALIIDKNITASISDAQSQQALILVVFSISFVIVSSLFWFQILRNLREINNDFKKVLQVFPPKLILSSFLLKTFLVKTSRHVPDL